MSGLKQAALLAYKNLKNSLVPYGYYPIQGTVGLWEYQTRLIKFYLSVDDFGIKFWSKEDAQHLCNAIRVMFKYTVDSYEIYYYSLNLDWYYNLGHVDITDRTSHSSYT